MGWARVTDECLERIDEHWLNAAETACEQEGPDPRLRALSDALRDAISTYGPKDEILVTEERQEAWKSVLRKYGA